jgi:hypothetical protein
LCGAPAGAHIIPRWGDGLQPALFVTGECDPAAKPMFGIDRQSAAFESLRTNFAIYVTSSSCRASVTSAEERPEEINAVVLTFLKDISIQ